MDAPAAPESPPARKRENVFLSLGFNLVLPVLIFSKGQDFLPFEPLTVLFFALAFPLGYGIWDLISRKHFNWISLLGIISIGLTGGFSFFELDRGWLAVKEASIPLIIGLFLVFSLKTSKPLIHRLLYNPEIFNTPLIDERLKQNQAMPAFKKLTVQCTFLMGAAFLVSSVLNYLMVFWIIHSPPGTEAYNHELGRMTALSYPIIVLPSSILTFAALFLLIRGLNRLTGLKFEEMVHADPQKQKK